jgi:6-pyruvoyltetrahydropterin/6-carboxytetrahydropterin synthase
MSKHLIKRQLTLDAAHRVPMHTSKCKSIHGHTYKVEVSFCADALTLSGAEEGMVTDFGVMKDLMMKLIHDPCDHKMIVYYKDPWIEQLRPAQLGHIATNHLDKHFMKGMSLEGEHKTQLHVVNFIPTAENLAHYWFLSLKRHIEQTMGETPPFKVACVGVWETPNCYAEYKED